MKMSKYAYMNGILIFMISAFFISCASIPVLKVNYQVPAPSDRLKGKKLFLSLHDSRKVKGIIGRGALKAFKNFPGNLSFTIKSFNEPDCKIGSLQVMDMFHEALKRRLETEGVELLRQATSGEDELVIVLNEFLLDFIDRKWIARMSFEAKLMKNGNMLGSQTILGQATHVRLFGRNYASTVVGEIFTDTINILDVSKLFRQDNCL